MSTERRRTVAERRLARAEADAVAERLDACVRIGRAVAHTVATGRSADLRDELVQAGEAAAWRALETWRPESGCPLKVWVTIKARGAALDELRRWTGRRGKARSDAPWTVTDTSALPEALLRFTVDVGADPADAMDVSGALRALRDAEASKKAGPRAALSMEDVALRYARGERLQALADEVGVTESRVSQILGAARAVLASVA